MLLDDVGWVHQHQMILGNCNFEFEEAWLFGTWGLNLGQQFNASAGNRHNNNSVQVLDE